MNSRNRVTGSRWCYARRIDHFSGDIVSLFSVRVLDIQMLCEGKWEAANYRRWFDVIEDPEFECLSRQETTNLNNFLHSG